MTAGHLAEAIQCPVVILAMPWTRIEEALKSVGGWQDRILIDATDISLSYAPDFAVDDLGEDSGSEIVARLAPDSRVVKAFNTLPIEDMFAPLPSQDLRRVLFVAGGDEAAVDSVQQMVSDIGLHPVALGALSGLELFRDASKNVG